MIGFLCPGARSQVIIVLVLFVTATTLTWRLNHSGDVWTSFFSRDVWTSFSSLTMPLSPSKSLFCGGVFNFIYEFYN